MGRKKIRNHISVEEFESIINNYFDLNKNKVIEELCKEHGFDNIDDLHEFDIHGSYFGGFGLDCGFIQVHPLRQEQYREWCLDSDLGKWGAYASRFKYPYQTQSTTCKKFEIKMALKDLNLQNLYGVNVILD